MPRFHVALLGALALHGLLLLARSQRDLRVVQSLPEPAAEQVIDIEDPALGAARLTPPVDSDLAQSAAVFSPSNSSAVDVASLFPPGRVARAEPRLASSARSSAAPSGAPVDDSDLAAAGAAEPTGAAEVSAATAEHKIDLGLDGHFFLGPPSEMLPRIRKPGAKPQADPQRRLENALAADDVQRGLSRGNVLVGSLNAAARDAGPVRGDALFRVTVGADGGVLSAELLRGAGADWSAALSSFRALAVQKRLRVPPGARGLRVTFSVKAKVQRPSGKEVEASPVGVATPSLNPNGLVPHGDFDLADLGGGGQRLVYARVVSEEVL